MRVGSHREIFPAFISYGITLSLIALIVMLVLSGLVAFEGATYGTEYFVENGVKPTPKEPVAVVF
jgi:hypothetical protein